MEKQATNLVEYLTNVMEERRLSQRALALYVGVASSTISRIIAGEAADPVTLQKLAEYLNVPSKMLFELAGYIEPEDEIHSQAISQVAHLMKRLPEEDRKVVLELARSLSRRREEQAESEE